MTHQVPLPRLPAMLALLCWAAALSPQPAMCGSDRGVRARKLTTQTAICAFEQIHPADTAAYHHYQLKVTYLGNQDKSARSMAAVSTVRTGGYDGAAFVPFERAFRYSNDRDTETPLQFPPAELKAFVDSLGAHPGLQDTLAQPQFNVSLMILRDYGSQTACWEHIAPTTAQTDTLFQLLHDSVSSPDYQALIDHFRRMMAGVRR